MGELIEKIEWKCHICGKTIYVDLREAWQEEGFEYNVPRFCDEHLQAVCDALNSGELVLADLGMI